MFGFEKWMREIVSLVPHHVADYVRGRGFEAIDWIGTPAFDDYKHGRTADQAATRLTQDHTRRTYGGSMIPRIVRR